MQFPPVGTVPSPHRSLVEVAIESTKLVLTTEDMKEIDSALAEFKVPGGRMNEEQMKVVEQ